MLKETIDLNIDIIRKYESIKSPYYTTYPSGSEWDNNFTQKEYTEALKESCNKNGKTPMALYVHIPFCKYRCLFCFCYTKGTNDRAKINEYMQVLYKEIELTKKFFDENNIIPDVKEIHLGGGTPTHLTKEEFDSLVEKLELLAYDIKNLDEFALEIDPRTVTKEDLPHYFEKGINRISFGIQDFDEKVQKAVNRIQPYEMMENLLDSEARKCSINFDLIFGLPYQTRETFQSTIELVKKLNPDRLSIYNYDHTPDLHAHQKAIDATKLPSLEEKMQMYIDAIENLLGSGYEWVGIDHFAKPNDKLAIAAKNKTLGRNLNGYTTGRSYNREIGLGASSIGGFGNYYTQNIKEFEDYFKSINKGEFPVLRGYKLDKDDLIRRDVIIGLICNGFLNFREIEEKYSISFNDYFKNDLKYLDNFIKDEMVVRTDKNITVTPRGRIFIHKIGKVFDNYLKAEEKSYIRTHEAIKIHKLQKNKVNLLTGI